MLHMQRNQQRAATALAVAALRRARPLLSRHASASAAASAASAASSAAAPAASQARPARRLTWMQEQTRLDEQRRAHTQTQTAASAASAHPAHSAAPVSASPAAASSPPAAAESAEPTVEPAPSASASAAASLLPSLRVSRLLLRPPSQSAVSLRPRSAVDSLSLLCHAGLVRRLGSAVALLPSGLRALSKVERALSDEIAAADLQPQDIEISTEHASAVAELSHAAAAPVAPAVPAVPYPPSFASQLPLCTQLLADEFRADVSSAYAQSMERATIAMAVAHPAAAAVSTTSKTLGSARSSPSSSSLWSAAKSTRDFAQLSSGSRSSALDRYHSLLDCYARTMHQLGEPDAFVVESNPSARGAQGVDSDLAHELHVTAFNPVTDAAAAAGAHKPSARAHSPPSLLKCDKCDYVAKLERAVSKVDVSLAASSSPAELSSVTPSPQNLPAPLQSFFRAWIVRQLSLSFPPSVVERLNLAEQSSRWKCEMLVDRSLLHAAAPSDAEAAAQALPIVYLVLLREGDEINVAAVSDHTTSQNLRRIDDPALASEVLRRTLAADELASLPALAAPSAAASSRPSARFRPEVRFDPRPELLVDSSLIPEGLDLDMEAIALAQQQEAEAAAEQARVAEEQRLQEAEQIEAAAAASAAEIAAAPSDDSSVVATTAAHAKFERVLSSAARSLAPGQSLDLLQMDLASQGVNPEQARAQLVHEARELQRKAHEDRDRASQDQQNEEMMRQLEAAEAGEELEDEDAADEDDEPVEPAAAASDDAAAPAASADATSSSPLPVSSSLASSPLRHFEYSPQGFFRLAQAGEACAMHGCAGHLRPLHTHVLANAAFIGRQELVDAENEDEEATPRAANSQRKQKKKKKYLHTTYGRFSSYDVLTHLLLKSLKLPAAPAAAGNPATPASGLTLDSLTMLHYPGLLAPIQLAFVPVLSSSAEAASPANPRDFHRLQNQARFRNKHANHTDARVWEACEQLHQQVAALSLAPPTLEQAALGVASFPSALDGAMVVEDRTALGLNVRVQSLVAQGVPVMVLIQPKGLLAGGFVSLVLNREGVALTPRRVPIQGLAALLHKMMRANYAAVLQSKRAQQQEKQKQEEDKRKKEDDMAAAKVKAEQAASKLRRS